MNTTAATTLDEKLNEATAAAEQEATAARQDYQTVSLAVLEGTATAKSLERAAAAVREADQKVANAAAAREAGETRAARIAEEARAAEAAALHDATQAQLRKIEQSAEAWDEALTALVDATSEHDTNARGLYALHVDPMTIRRMETARSMTMQIIGYRLAAFVGDGHRPPFFPEAHSRLTHHTPRATPAPTLVQE